MRQKLLPRNSLPLISIQVIINRDNKLLLINKYKNKNVLFVNTLEIW